MAVRIVIDEQRLETPAGPTLFECAEQVGVRVPTSCRKNGKCRECLVEILAGAELLSAPSAEESHLRGAFRLSCRARVAEEEGELRCTTLRRGRLRIEDSGVARAALAAPVWDPAVERVGGDVLLDGEPIDTYRGAILGLAVDIGTTTVVVRLVDLEGGGVLASTSFENPQRFGGSDVMARIRYDTENPGRLLQRTLLGYLLHAIESFGRDAATIYELVVAGNSTMRDLFFGLCVEPIGQRPYRSIVEIEVAEGRRATTSLVASPRELRLPMSPRGRVVGLPIISGHVGADTAACLLAVGLLEEERQVALMDIGTNTELIVKTGGRVLAASCPAGPAFEGGAITCGMPGLEGAIEGVRIDGDAVALRVIGDLPPTGICGSGLIEALGELARAGRIDEFGRLVDGSDRWLLDPAGAVALTEADISELAQAKGANVAGLRIVLRRAGIDVDDLDVFWLAGGFGRHIDLDAARRIGLVPDLPDERIERVGNAAIEGATIALLSASRREALEGLTRRVEHVELECEPDFFDHFVDGCLFHPLRSARREAP